MTSSQPPRYVCNVLFGLSLIKIPGVITVQKIIFDVFVFVCECVGVWVCGCVGVCMCMCMGIKAHSHELRPTCAKTCRWKFEDHYRYDHTSTSFEWISLVVCYYTNRHPGIHQSFPDNLFYCIGHLYSEAYRLLFMV